MTIATKQRVPSVGRSLLVASELEALLSSVDDVCEVFNGDLNFVELGTRYAGTSARVTRKLEKRGVRYDYLGVDIDPMAGRNWFARMEPVKRRGHVRFCLGTTAAASDLVSAIHWCFLDACHCEECAYRDLEVYGGKVVRCGLLLVHDTAKHKPKYEHMTQHQHTRPYGVLVALARSGVIAEHFRLLREIDDHNGLRIYERTS